MPSWILADTGCMKLGARLRHSLQHCLRGTAGALLFASLSAEAAVIVPGSPTSNWLPIPYSLFVPDFYDDQRTGIPEADIVGNLANPAFYTAFDDAGTPSLSDGFLGFRVRVGADKNPVGFTQFMGVGVDANFDG